MTVVSVSEEFIQGFNLALKIANKEFSLTSALSNEEVLGYAAAIQHSSTSRDDQILMWFSIKKFPDNLLVLPPHVVNLLIETMCSTPWAHLDALRRSR